MLQYFIVGETDGYFSRAVRNSNITQELRLNKSECFHLIYVCFNLFGVYWNSLYVIYETNIPKQKFYTFSSYYRQEYYWILLPGVP
jgi:hypothetical protein